LIHFRRFSELEAWCGATLVSGGMCTNWLHLEGWLYAATKGVHTPDACPTCVAIVVQVLANPEFARTIKSGTDPFDALIKYVSRETSMHAASLPGAYECTCYDDQIICPKHGG
jgi:hypothetical protein